MLYLLDTNILLAYMRRSPLQQSLEEQYSLSTVNPSPIISVVSEAEIRTLAEENQWGVFKLRMLEQMLQYLTVIPIPFATIVDSYIQVEKA